MKGEALEGEDFSPDSPTIAFVVRSGVSHHLFRVHVPICLEFVYNHNRRHGTRDIIVVIPSRFRKNYIHTSTVIRARHMSRNKRHGSWCGRRP